MGDSLLTFKYVLKNVAWAAGKSLTFMPKPIFEDNGSGMHVHQSLWKGGEPLFYDERGSALFEQITQLPEYYLTRTERSIFTEHADAILEAAAAGHTLTVLELGAGTASKTGILLSAAVRRQGSVLYQPVDVSPSALDEAAANLRHRESMRGDEIKEGIKAFAEKRAPKF